MRFFKFSNIACSLVAIAAMCTTSCSDDDPVKTPIDIPSIQVTQASHNSLSFEWSAVDGAVQYGYKLCDSMGEIVDGGVTNITSVSFSGLALLSEYTLHLWAYPSMADEAATASDEAIMTCSTSFYTALNDSGVLTSAVVPNGSYDATIVEERTSQDRFGTFTIKGFYGAEGYDLVFTVNANNTINILNGEVDATTGWIKMKTGNSNVRVKNGLLINQADSYFDRENLELYFYAKATRGSSEGYDYYTWAAE